MKIIAMWAKASLVLSILTILVSCKENPKKEADTGVPVSEAPPESEIYSGETQTSWDYCFASRTATPEAFGQTFNYWFIRLSVEKDGKVTGTMINAPYGTDGSRGSISGTYLEDGKQIESTTTYLAEGELYAEERNYQIGEAGLSTLNSDGNAIFAVPKVSCELYDQFLKEYRSGILEKQINTTDRTRLAAVVQEAQMGLSAAKLDSLRFMERWIDLDNNYETEEYLLYIMDPMVCGSGGCNLFVIDGEGKIRSKTTVVKMPVYSTTNRIGDPGQKGSWRTLYVWNRGFRELAGQDGTYPANASMAPEISEDTLTGHPETYQLIMDYRE